MIISVFNCMEVSQKSRLTEVQPMKQASINSMKIKFNKSTIRSGEFPTKNNSLTSSTMYDLGYYLHHLFASTSTKVILCKNEMQSPSKILSTLTQALLVSRLSYSG